MDHDDSVVWLLDDIAEAEGLSWNIHIWAIEHDFRESGWLKMVILWDDGEWLMMIEWGDCQRALMIIIEQRWELSHDFKEVDMVVFDRC